MFAIPTELAETLRRPLIRRALPPTPAAGNFRSAQEKQNNATR